MPLEFTGERFVPKLRGPISYEHVHRYALAARFVSGKRVLDIASGEGYGSKLLARTANIVVGVDIDEPSIEHARRHYYAPNLRFVCGSCEEIPFPPGSFDVIVSFETIEHTGDYRRMLDEVRRVLADDGHLIMSSPNKLVYSDIPAYRNPFHIRELYYNELRDELTRRFPNVGIYGQRIAASSIVFPLRDGPVKAATWYAGNVERIEEGLPELSDPVYFVAIAGPNQDDVIANLSSSFVDINDDLLDDMRRDMLTIREEAKQQLARREEEWSLTAREPIALTARAITSDLSSAAIQRAASDSSEVRIELVTVLNELAASIEIPNYVMPDAVAEPDEFARTVAAELRKAVMHLRTVTLAASNDRAGTDSALGAASRITSLEQELTAAQDVIALLREQSNASRAERLKLVQEHLLELRSLEIKSTAIRMAELDRVDRESASIRLADVARVQREADSMRRQFEGEIVQYARERDLLRAMLSSKSWTLTKPFRITLAKLRRAKTGTL